jgi:serralysin
VVNLRASSITVGGISVGTNTARDGFGTIDSLINIDRISGSNHADRLYGNSAGNRLEGRGGDDLLVGGTGKDNLFGGTGADRFDYNTKGESGVGATNRDVIVGFDNPGAAAGDCIDLSGIDAKDTSSGNQAFVWRGTGAFTGAGQLRVFNSGANTIAACSTDSDAAAEFEVAIQDGSFTASSWKAADFVL